MTALTGLALVGAQAEQHGIAVNDRSGGIQHQDISTSTSHANPLRTQIMHSTHGLGVEGKLESQGINRMQSRKPIHRVRSVKGGHTPMSDVAMDWQLSSLTLSAAAAMVGYCDG